MLNVCAVAVIVALLVLQGHGLVRGSEGDGGGHVPCDSSGPQCGAALQAAIDAAPAGATITLEAGRVYEGSFVVKAKPGAAPGKVLTITTRGWASKGDGWAGLVTPADRAKMAVLRGARGNQPTIDVPSGAATGYLAVVGVAFDAVPPEGRTDLVRIGSGRDSTPQALPRHVTLREVLLQGDRNYGQKRAIAANGQDITIDRIWCEEIFTAGQESQCIAAWSGGHRVSVRHSYLAAGSENILVGGAPVAATAMQPAEWIIEDVILHKPLRWQQDARNRAVKNLLEFKHARQMTVRRVLAVNNWRAAQSGRGLVIHHTTNGRCPECGNLERILIEDFVMLNVAGGVSFQGFAWQPDSHSASHLRDVTLRNVYVHSTSGARLLEIANVRGRHDIRVERSTFVNDGTGWLMGDFGMTWADEHSRTPGGPMQGLSIVDNVIATNGTYGITAPQGQHYGTGVGAFVSEDLQIAGNVIGDAPPDHLKNYNAHTAAGSANVSVERDALVAKLPTAACGAWQPGKGADCARLAPVFALMKRLPEP